MKIRICPECLKETSLPFSKGVCKNCYSKTYRKLRYELKKDIIKERQRKYYRENIDKIKEYRKNSVSKIQKTRRKYENSIRLEILIELGNRCVQCGYDDWRGLQLDHINSDGAIDRARFKRPKQLYVYYLKNKKEMFKNLQILCANCNQIKKYTHDECRKISSIDDSNI